MSASGSDKSPADEPMIDEELNMEEANDAEESDGVPEDREFIKERIPPMTIDNIEDDNKNVTFTFHNEDHTLGNVINFN